MRLILRFLREYALKYWHWYLLGLLALYGTNQLTVMVPQLTREALDALGNNDLAVSRHKVLLIALSAVGIMIIRIVSRLCFFNPGRATEFSIKNHLFRHLIQLPSSFHDQSRVGDLMSRLTNDLMNVRALIGFASLQILEGIMVVPLALHQMLSLDRTLTLYTFAMLGLAVVVLWISAAQAVVLMRRNMEQLSELSDHILGTYSAMPVVQGFNAQESFANQMEDLNQRYIQNTLKLAAIRAYALPVVTLLGSLAVGIVLWKGGEQVSQGTLTVGALAAFSGYIGILSARLMGFGWMLSVIQRGMVSLQRVYSLLDTPLEAPAPLQALPDPITTPSGTGYRLEARGLNFTYQGSEERPPSLQDIHFSVDPGQTLGIFGHTGSGKSTLVHLLARVYTPARGQLFLNGVDVCDLPVAGLRDQLALVPQDPFLFSMSIRENILWGDPSCPPELQEARLKAVTDTACLENDLRALSKGLDTPVGSRGVTLSGGQRQRVALARAFFRKYNILLLDDVLAAVDHATEARLIDHIYAEKEHGSLDQTTVIVSHRISALKHADRILVLDHGRVVALGSHEALLAQGGIYAETWAAQQDSGEEASDVR